MKAQHWACPFSLLSLNPQSWEGPWGSCSPTALAVPPLLCGEGKAPCPAELTQRHVTFFASFLMHTENCSHATQVARICLYYLTHALRIQFPSRNASSSLGDVHSTWDKTPVVHEAVGRGGNRHCSVIVLLCYCYIFITDMTLPPQTLRMSLGRNHIQPALFSPPGKDPEF